MISDSSFGIYIHWPFCAKKCPYCDFNSYVRSAVDMARWLKAFEKQLLWYKEHTWHVGRPSSIFFGGGTPSLADASVIEGILNCIERLWGIDEKTEISLEANPTSLSKEKIGIYKRAGVNRISLGVQSLHNDVLKFLGRWHDVDGALRALHAVQENFDRYSFDLIYARPDQTEKEWREELSQALTLAGDHLSLYQLTFEENTPFYNKKKQGLITELSSDAGAQLYDMTCDMLETYGFIPYEVSNYAKKGHECLHNLIYWRYNPYIGVGPGAHGRITMRGTGIQDHRSRDVYDETAFYATMEYKNPEKWLEAVLSDTSAFENCDALSAQDRAIEMLMMGLRLFEGVQGDALLRKTGMTFEQSVDQEQLKMLVDDDFLRLDDGQLQATKKGRLCLNAVIQDLLR